MSETVDSEFILHALQELVKTNSVNPGLISDGLGETEAGKKISNFLNQIGLESQTREIEPNRVNVVAVLKGTGGGRSLMLNGHMDTVGVEGMTDPFSGEARDGKVFGRGSQDMKGGIASMLGAFKFLKDSNTQLRGDVIFAAVADEEHRSIGTEALVKEFKTHAAIVAEPTDLNICLAHRGFNVFEIETKGRAAHGSRYQEGRDANMAMGLCLAELFSLSKELIQKDGHSLLGPPSLHVPLVKGGTELFVYADKCKISVERRTLPGEKQEDLHNEIDTLLARLSQQEASFQAELKPGLFREAYEISPDAEIVKLVSGTAQQILGETPNFIGHQWWEDSALIAETGAQTVIFGPKGEGLHSHEEWVDIQSVYDVAEILARTVMEFCA